MSKRDFDPNLTIADPAPVVPYSATPDPVNPRRSPQDETVSNPLGIVGAPDYNLGIAKPATPYHPAVLEAAKRHGDQPLSGTEIDLGGGVSMTVGVRNLYLRTGGHWVFVIPGRAIDVTVPEA